MLIYNYQKEFIGIDEADLEVFGFANLAELKAEASDFADMFVRTPGYIHNFKHVHWIDFVTCAEPTEESKVIIEINGKTFKANIGIETIYLSDNPTSKAYLINLNNLRSLTVKENGEISEDIARKRPKRVEPSVGFAFNEPQDAQALNESEGFDHSNEYDSTSLLQEVPELEGFKPFDNIDQVEDVEDTKPLDISFDDEIIDEPAFSNTDSAPLQEAVEEEQAPIEIEDAYSIDVVDVETTPEEEVISTTVEAEDDGFDYSYNYDPQVASDELGLPLDLIEEFIEDFIAQAHDFKDDLFNSLDDGDLDNVKVLSHKLKGVAANLRIEDAFNTLSIINTSSDASEVESHLKIFYKIIAKLSGEDIQTAQVTEKVEPTQNVQEEDELYEDDLIIDFKNDATEKIEEPLEENETKANETEAIEEIEISIQDDDEKKDEPLDIKIEDSEVPQKIEMPELADDDFLNDTVQEKEEEEIDVNIDDLLSIDISEDEKIPPEEEILEIEENLVIEDEPLEVKYSKELVAGEIGLDQESFNEIFEDYIADSKSSIHSISDAISEGDHNRYKKEALKLKGMSDNMRVNAFSDQLNTLINSSDKDELTNAVSKIDAVIAQISK